MLIAYSCQQNLFPIYAELKRKTRGEATAVFGWATFLVSIIYVFLSVVVIYMFGKSAGDHDMQDVLKLIHNQCSGSKEGGDYKCPVESYILRFIFLIVLFCHIPFIFFSGKEGVLIVIDELDRRSISSALDYKIKVMKEAQREDADDGGIEFRIEDDDEQLHQKLIKARTDAHNSYRESRHSSPDIMSKRIRQIPSAGGGKSDQHAEMIQIQK